MADTANDQLPGRKLNPFETLSDLSNSARSFRETGPGTPVPIGRESTIVRGTIPISAFVRKTSAAVHNASGLTTLSTTSRDRKSTRLNSSHANISYAVF